MTELVNVNMYTYYHDNILTKIIEANPSNIQYFPSTLYKYDEYVTMALNIDPLVLKYVNKKYHTIDRVRKCVMKDGLYIEHIDNKPELICLLAVEQNPEALRYIPIFQTEKICERAVEKNGMMLKYCNHTSHKIIKLALTQNPDAIEFINFHKIDNMVALGYIAVYLENGGSFKKLKELLDKQDYLHNQYVCNGTYKSHLLRDKYIKQLALQMDPLCKLDVMYV